MAGAAIRRPFGRLRTRFFCDMVRGNRAGRRRRSRIALLVAALPFLALVQPLQAASDPYIHPRKPIAAPEGFAGICDRYRWACARGGTGGLAGAQAVRVAKAINAAVNRTTRAISDRRQYGTEEVWALPTAAGGDCEDIVLLKKMKLIGEGVAPDRLLIATVLDRRGGSHAVLVLRTEEEGDLVLDNLGNRVVPWTKTGYSFLRMQNPSSPRKWDAVFAGGMFGS